MPYLMYYDPDLDEVVQTWIENGTPIDQAASTLGIIALNLDEFPGVTLVANPIPIPVEVNDGNFKDSDTEGS